MKTPTYKKLPLALAALLMLCSAAMAQQPSLPTRITPTVGTVYSGMIQVGGSTTGMKQYPGKELPVYNASAPVKNEYMDDGNYENYWVIEHNGAATVQKIKSWDLGTVYLPDVCEAGDVIRVQRVIRQVKHGFNPRINQDEIVLSFYYPSNVLTIEYTGHYAGTIGYTGDTEVCGGGALGRVSVGGTDALTFEPGLYFWEIKKKGKLFWDDLHKGKGASSLDLDPISEPGVYSIRCRLLHSKCGEYYSAAGTVEITVKPPVAPFSSAYLEKVVPRPSGMGSDVYMLGGGASLCGGGNSALRIYASHPSSKEGDTWTLHKTAGGHTTDIALEPSFLSSGAAHATYPVPGETGETVYRISMGNSCGTAESRALTVEYYPPLEPGSGDDVSACGSEAAVLTAGPATGGHGGYEYTWEQYVAGDGWTDVGYGETYMPAKGTEGVFRRSVSNSCGTAETGEIALSIYSPPGGGSLTAENEQVAEGAAAGTVTGTAVADPAGGEASYSWTRTVSGTVYSFPVTEAEFTKASITDNTKLSRTAVYTRTAHTSCGDASASATVRVIGALDAGYLGIDDGTESYPQRVNVCKGGDYTVESLTAASGGVKPYRVEWYMTVDRGDSAMIHGTDRQAVITGLSGGTVTVKKKVTDAENNAAVSNPFTITVTGPPAVPELEETELETCAGTKASGQFSLRPSSYDPAADYTWQWSLGNGLWNDEESEAGLSVNPYPYSTATGSPTYYRMLASNSCGESWSGTAALSAYPKVTAVRVTLGSGEICSGGRAEARATFAGGSGEALYYWVDRKTATVFVNGEEGRDTLSFAPSYSGSPQLAVSVKSGNCPYATDTETFTVLDKLEAPVIACWDEDFNLLGKQVVCHSAAPLMIERRYGAKGGRGGFSYQWQQSADGAAYTDIPGETGYELQPGRLTETTLYRLKAVNSCGTVYSESFTVQVLPEITAPQLPGDVSSQTLCHGAEPGTVYGGEATGGWGEGSFSYSWLVLNSDPARVFSDSRSLKPSYGTGGMRRAQAYRYRIVSTDPAGTGGSCPAVIADTVSYAVLAELTGNTIAEAQSVAYNTVPEKLTGGIVTGGDGSAASYSWEQSRDGENWVAACVGCGRDYQPTALAATTFFRRQASVGGCPAGVSNTVEVNVYEKFSPGIIDLEDGENTVCYRQSPGRVIMSQPPAGGVGSYTYQWQEKIGKTGEWEDIIGGNSTSITVKAADAGVRYYRIFVTDNISGDYDTTNVVPVFTYEKVDPGYIEDDYIITCNNSFLMLDVVNPTPPTGGNNSYEYNWVASTDGVVYNNLFPAVKTEVIQPLHSGPLFYKREVITICGVYETNVFTVDIALPLDGGTITEDQIICEGTRAEIVEGTEATGGTGRYGYTWFMSYDNEIFTKLSGEKGLSIKPPKLDSTFYLKRMADADDIACPVDYSNTVKIEVTPPLTPAVIAGDTTLCEGLYSGYITETAKPSGGARIERYWEISWDGLDFSRLSSYTSLEFMPPVKADSSFTVRQAAASLNCPVAYSNRVRIEALEKIRGGTVTSSYSTGMNCPGGAPQAAYLSAASGGTHDYTYGWEKSLNGKLFSPLDEEGAYYITDTLLYTHYYRVKVSDSICGSAYSDTLKVQVASGFDAGRLPAEQVARRGAEPSAVSLKSATKGGTGDYSYSWYVSGGDGQWGYIPGADSAHYQPGPQAEAAYFMMKAGDGCSSDSTNVHTLTVLDPMEQEKGRDTAVCRGTSPGVLRMPPPKGGRGPYRFLWEQSADGRQWETAVLGERDSLAVLDKLGATMFYRRTAWTPGFDTVTSGTLTVTALDPVSPPLITGGQDVCFGAEPHDLQVRAEASGGSGAYTYTWYTNRGGNFAAEAEGGSFSPGALTRGMKIFAEASDGMCGFAGSDTSEITVLPVFAPGRLSAEATVSYGARVQVSGTPARGGSGIYEYIFRVSAGDSIFMPAYSEENSPAASMKLHSTALVFRTDIDSVCGAAVTDTLKINVLPQLNGGAMASVIKPCSGGQSWLKPSPPSGGAGGYRFEWHSAGPGGQFSRMIYAQEDSLLTPPADTTAYYRRITVSGSDTAWTNTVMVSPYPRTLPAAISGGQQVCPGERPLPVETLQPASGGRGATGYEWQVSASGAQWEAFSSGGYMPEMLVDSSASLYVRIKTSNSCGEELSNKVYIRRLAPVAGNVIESNSRYVENGTAPEPLLGSVPSGGDGVFSYYYQQSADSGETWLPVVSDKAEKDYAPPALFAAVMYRRLAESACGTDTSAAVSIDILPELVAGAVSSSHSVCRGMKGDTLRGTAAAGGSNAFHYSWQSSPDGLAWTGIADADGLDFLPGAVNADTWFRRKDSAEYLKPKFTNAVKISVLPVPAAPVILSEAVYCKGTDAVLTADSAATEGRTYRWVKDGGDAGTGRTLKFAAERDAEISLFAYSADGCVSPETQGSVSVDTAEAAFYAEVSSIGRTSAAHFIITTPDVAAAEWEFYDGDGSTRLSPFHYYYSPGLYDVRLDIVTVNGCADSVTMEGYIHVSATTGVTVSTGLSVSALPSPFSGRLVISALGEFTYRVTDAGGRAVAAGRAVNSETVETGGFAPGVYFVKATSAFGSETVKTVKN